MEKKLTVFPSWYPDFACKCGQCRHTCCNGWKISVTKQEYYNLIGLSCGKKLRCKLDCAFVPADMPDNERFAYISPNYEGKCPMLDDDGYCLLHKECGAEALSMLCRVYPRSIKSARIHEAGTSLACEATVELLMRDTDPVTFIEDECELPFDGIKINGTEPTDEMIAVRHGSIDIIADRSMSIAERMMRLCLYLHGGIGDVPSSDSDGMGLMLKFIRAIEHRCDDLRFFGEKAIGALGIEKDGNFDVPQAIDKYISASAHLRTVIPDVDVYTEKILVNHLFFEQFPYVDSVKKPRDAVASLCLGLALLDLVTVGYMSDSDSRSDYVDAVAAVFRFIEHTDFYAFGTAHIFPPEQNLCRMLSFLY
ncbi:MAG: flagellin lysine-N-methylase [Clostridia bacterium]|nr:flagellin lysine-N-methylase [Clostridia bacterium]